MTELKDKILSNPLNSKVFSSGRNIFLVGGYLRDILARGVQSKDLDYAVQRGWLRATVKKVSRDLSGRVVELRKERIMRIVLKDGTTIDFGLIQGDIYEDLSCRDFTFNAMAWSPETGLLDPMGGLADLKKGVVRGISRDNFKEDPIRLLRAYRFVGEKSWRIEKKTRRILKEMHSNIGRSAFERITLEFFKLLNSKNAFVALQMALRDGILSEIFPLSFNRLENNIKLISKYDEKPEKINEIVWFKEFSQGLSMSGLIRLECLLLGAEPDKALRLSLSRKIYKNLVLVNNLYDDFRRIDFSDKRRLFDALSDAGPAAVDLLVLTGMDSHMDEVWKFKRVFDRGVITAEEIMSKTGLRPGIKLGKAVNHLKKLQFEGTVRKKSDAIRWLKNEYPILSLI
jgi:tRNA nucleotidyltransferase (CCA-adding enzyme)